MKLAHFDDDDNFTGFFEADLAQLPPPALSEASGRPRTIVAPPEPEYDPATHEAILTRDGWEVRALTDLEGLRARKIAALAEACRAAYEAPLTTSYGAVFWTDASTILDVMNIIALIPPEAVYEGYKGADDVWRDLTREQFQLALQEGGLRKSAAFARRKTLTLAALAATTVEELAAVAW
jgi:hypothetical protein